MKLTSVHTENFYFSCESKGNKADYLRQKMLHQRMFLRDLGRLRNNSLLFEHKGIKCFLKSLNWNGNHHSLTLRWLQVLIRHPLISIPSEMITRSTDLSCIRVPLLQLHQSTNILMTGNGRTSGEFSYPVIHLEFSNYPTVADQYHLLFFTSLLLIR